MTRLAAIRARRAQQRGRPTKRLPRMQPPDAAERTYARELLAIVAVMRRAVERRLGPILERLAREQEATRQDEAMPDFGRLVREAELEFERTITKRTIEGIGSKVGEQLDLFNSRQVERQLGAVLPIDVRASFGSTAEEIGAFAREGVDLITTMSAEYFDEVQAKVQAGFEAGRRASSIAKDINERGEVSESRAKFIARDQVSKLNAKLTKKRHGELGIKRYIWRTSKDSRVRSRHRELDGKTFDWDDPPIVDEATGRREHPGGDYQCLPGTSKVQFAPAAEKLYRRRHSGELAIIVSDSGEALRCTPNHPVLTSRGWVQAQFVEEGDDLFQVADDVGFAAGLDVDHDPTTISQVFEAAMVLGLPVSVGVGGDFHGDVAEGEIEVVSVDGALPDHLDSFFTQGVCEFLLAWADANLPDPHLASAGTEALLRLRLGAAPARIVRGAGKLLAFFGGHGGLTLEHRRAAVARLHAALEEHAANDDARDAKLLRDALLADAGEVLLGDRFAVYLFAIMGRAAVLVPSGIDSTGSELHREVVGVNADALANLSKQHPSLKHLGRVVEKRVGESFSGHVYNLQTAAGWYQADGLIVHNCRCRAEPDLESLLDELEASDVPPVPAEAMEPMPVAAQPILPELPPILPPSPIPPLPLQAPARWSPPAASPRPRVRPQAPDEPVLLQTGSGPKAPVFALPTPPKPKRKATTKRRRAPARARP